MKQTILLFIFLFIPFAAQAQTDKEIKDVVLTLTHEEESPELKPRIPEYYLYINVYLSNQSVSWGSQFSFCGIELLTEDGTVVFSQPLSGMESSVSIPETLSGTFIIVMYLGDMVYTVEITI